MAEYVSSRVAVLTDLGDGTYEVILRNNGLTYTATDGDALDQNFVVGEAITAVQDNSFTLNVTYLGRSGEGWIGDRDGQTLYWFTNEPITIGQIVMLSATDLAVCFLVGTRIATPDGERAVENLAIGDLVTTPEGAARPVRWIGRQAVARAFADPLRSLPVTIRAGALGQDVPLRDLHLSPDHALLVDGLLVHAGALVNGRSIIRMADVPAHFTYYHVELADHALLLAEGAPAESFVDNVTRRRFDNWSEYAALDGEEADTGEMERPRVKSTRQMPRAMLDRLERRADLLSGEIARAA